MEYLTSAADTGSFLNFFTVSSVQVNQQSFCTESFWNNWMLLSMVQICANKFSWLLSIARIQIVLLAVS
jgi:hypothetical protein